MDFDQFKTFVSRPNVDIEKFRDMFSIMLDCNGAVASETVGFNLAVCLDSETDLASIADEKLALEVISVFQPAVIWAGSYAVAARLSKLGHASILHPFFQDGAFAVVLKVPVQRKTHSSWRKGSLPTSVDIFHP